MKDINKILFKLSRWSGYVLIVLMVLYFISGYGMTKQIIDPVLAKTLHEKWLLWPTVIALLLHTLFRLRCFLIKKIKNEVWVNVYIIILYLVILGIFFYLDFL